MSNKDLNQIAKIEKAIKEKYGSEAIQNPKGSWDSEKEEKFLKDLKPFYLSNKRKKEEIDHDGFTLRHRKTKTQTDRTCPVCESYSFSEADDVYMVKFDCCFECYIQYVEDREERWNSGWRPNK